MKVISENMKIICFAYQCLRHSGGWMKDILNDWIKRWMSRWMNKLTCTRKSIYYSRVSRSKRLTEKRFRKTFKPNWRARETVNLQKYVKSFRRSVYGLNKFIVEMAGGKNEYLNLVDDKRKLYDWTEVPSAWRLSVEFHLRTIDKAKCIDYTVVVGVWVIMDVDHVTFVYIMLGESRTHSRVDTANLNIRLFHRSLIQQARGYGRARGQLPPPCEN